MPIPHRWLSVLVLALAFGLVSSMAGAAGDSSSTSSQAPAESARYTKAKAAVESMDYRAAITLLEGVIRDKPGHADALNYLGYSHRKLGEFKQSLAYYTKALEIDPGHRRANEYLGELYLQMGQLSSAEKQLARLDDLCFWGCKELDDLKSAIKQYRARKSG
ncbi:MAG: tetratricopeptide repeat protein [Rhodospirillales bacterium]|nr:tetratricopeptide repeat protein [Rhodospirillales bacterium]